MNRNILLASLLAATAAFGFACNTSSESGSQVASSGWLPTTAQLPTGFVCGLAHTGDIPGKCEDTITHEVLTTNSSREATGFRTTPIGDQGMPGGQGFVYQRLEFDTAGALNVRPENVRLPQGAICGLGVNGDGTCFGAQVRTALDCPAGWTFRRVMDVGAYHDGERFWTYCTYNDQNLQCAGGSCVAELPIGTTCGLRYLGRGGELDFNSCLGVGDNGGHQNADCPAGFEPSGSKGRDDRAPGGHGLFWCSKQ